LLGTLKDRIHPDYPNLLVNLKTVSGLEYVKREEGRIVIGSMTRLADLAVNPLVRKIFPALAGAARSVATPQIRNMATLGGNLCQEPRCWYYRHPDNRYHCLRKGGTPARRGLGKTATIRSSARCAGVRRPAVPIAPRVPMLPTTWRPGGLAILTGRPGLS